MEDFADLLRGAEHALAHELAEAGDVLQAGGGRAVAAEDADTLSCDLGDLGGTAGAGDRRLVPDVVVDEVALATALVAFPADEALIFEEGDGLGDGRRADLEVLDEFDAVTLPASATKRQVSTRAVILGRPCCIRRVVNASSYSRTASSSRPEPCASAPCSRGGVRLRRWVRRSVARWAKSAR